jgi:glycosyltransferase involved in cell wall biosynthesis
MRVAVVSPPWLPVPPVRYGGTESVIDTLVRGLERTGDEVLLCAPADSTSPVRTAATRERSAGTHAISAATELSHVVRAYDMLRAWGADVVHDHTLAGPLYAERTGLPVVTTNHGPFDEDLRPLYRAISVTTPIVAISHHQAGSAGDIPIAAVVHHGIDVDEFPFSAEPGEFALFVGRMTAQKGVARAIRIAKQASVPLSIVAKCQEPAEIRYFEERISPLLDDDVTYLGELTRQETSDVIAGARCLLNPIDWDEPFGMVMVESLACGTPVVATPRGSVPEIVTAESGVVADSDAALADAVIRSAELDRRACRAHARARFSSERMVDEYRSVYARVLSGYGGGAAAPTEAA